MRTIQAVHSEDFKQYDTNKIRGRFLLSDLKALNQANFVYSHYDRMITGLVHPGLSVITLGNYDILRSEYFLERREMGIINVGGPGQIEAEGSLYNLNKLDALYLGKGVKSVTFKSENDAEPALFYTLSAPAHESKPTTFLAHQDAFSMMLGSLENANERNIVRYIHKDGIQSCQLVIRYLPIRMIGGWKSTSILTLTMMNAFSISWANQKKPDISLFATMRRYCRHPGAFMLGPEQKIIVLYGVWLEKISTMQIWMPSQ
jgi:5-keto 4-deoxyuronate isomerase